MERKKAKVVQDIINKYHAPRKIEVNTTEVERRQSRLDSGGKAERLTKWVEDYPFFAKRDEIVTIISDRDNVLIVANKADERICVNREQVEILNG